MWPEGLVVIDGQTDFYGDSLSRQDEEVITFAGGWQQVVENYQVGRVLMPSDSELVERLQLLDGWQVVYVDQTAAVLDYHP